MRFRRSSWMSTRSPDPRLEDGPTGYTRSDPLADEGVHVEEAEATERRGGAALRVRDPSHRTGGGHVREVREQRVRDVPAPGGRHDLLPPVRDVHRWRESSSPLTAGSLLRPPVATGPSPRVVGASACWERDGSARSGRVRAVGGTRRSWGSSPATGVVCAAVSTAGSTRRALRSASSARWW